MGQITWNTVHNSPDDIISQWSTSALSPDEAHHGWNDNFFLTFQFHAVLIAYPLILTSVTTYCTLFAVYQLGLVDNGSSDVSTAVGEYLLLGPTWLLQFISIPWKAWKYCWSGFPVMGKLHRIALVIPQKEVNWQMKGYASPVPSALELTTVKWWST